MTLDELKEKWSIALEANSEENYVKATDLCREIVSAHPQFPQAWYMLAALSVKFKQHAVAKEYLDKAAPLMAKNYDLQLEVARLRYLVEDFSVAKRIYESLPGYETSPTIQFELAQCLWRLGDFSTAISKFKEVNESEEHLPKYSIALMKSYLSFGDKALARDVCANALDTYPDDETLYLYYLLFLWGRGLHSQVLERLPKDIESKSDETNYFCGFVSLVSDLGLQAEEYFHPTLQKESYRAKVKCLKEVNDKSLNKSDVFITFDTDIFTLAANYASEGDVYEFGTYRGRTAALLSSIFSNKKIFSFDSFKGLPEQWTKNDGPQTYNTNGQSPSLNLSNVEYVKGWYKDSLPEFFSKERNKASVIHIDCNLYSSTQLALEAIRPLIQESTVVILSNYYGYHEYEKHEYKAFNEFIENYGIQCDLLHYCVMTNEVLFQVKDI